MCDHQRDEARQRNLLRFVHAQDSGGIYENTGTYAEVSFHKCRDWDKPR